MLKPIAQEDIKSLVGFKKSARSINPDSKLEQDIAHTCTPMYTHTLEEGKLVNMFLTLLHFTNRLTVSLLRTNWNKLPHQ